MVLNGLSELLKWQQVSGGWRQQVLEKPAWQWVPQPAALASCLRVSGGGEQRQGSEIEEKGTTTCSSQVVCGCPNTSSVTGRGDTC